MFTFPVPIQGHEVKELPLEKSTLIETVALLSRRKDEPRIQIAMTCKSD